MAERNRGKLLILLCIILIMAQPAAGAAGTLEIKEIVIEGNTHVEAELIRGAVTQTQVGGLFSEEAIKADLQSIADLGFFQDVGARLNEAPGGAQVIFRVVENPVIQDVVVEGSTVLSSGEVAKYLSLEPGQVLNVLSLTEGLQGMADQIFSEHGVALRPADLAVEDDGTVKVSVVETRIASIEIAGNEKTKDDVIRRELRIKPGDILEMSKVYESLRRVLMLGYFDEVKPRFSDGPDPDQTVLTIQVTERKTGSAHFGAGYSSVDGFIGYIEVADKNFLGKGQEVNIRWEFGQNKNTYDLGFYEPHLDAKGTSFGFNLYNRAYKRTTRDEKDYTDRRTGGSLSLGRPLGDYTRGLVKFKLENTKLEYKDSEPEDQESSLRSVTLSALTNTTDHPFYPSQGFKSRLSAEIAGKVLGGDEEFIKYEGDFSKYLGLAEKHTLAFRVSTGTSTGELPEHEYFWVGGADTVRGYKYGESRGDKMFVINGEYRVRLVDAVQGVVFMDFGNAWEDESMDLTDLMRGYGAGIRLDTPLGIIRIDYGIGEDGGQTYFSFGQSF